MRTSALAIAMYPILSGRIAMYGVRENVDQLRLLLPNPHLVDWIEFGEFKMRIRKDSSVKSALSFYDTSDNPHGFLIRKLALLTTASFLSGKPWNRADSDQKKLIKDLYGIEA